MNTDEIISKVKSILTKGAADAKTAIEKAGDKVQKFSDESVVKIEKKQLEMKRNTKYQNLGEKLYGFITDKKIELPEAAAIEVESILEEIKTLSNQIKEKSDLLDNGKEEASN